MAPKYKLTYFNMRGLAETIRFLLSYMEEDFEDVRLERDVWDKMKQSTPFGKMPILEEEGKPVIVQSIAIARYLGKKAGLAGKDDWEDLQIDIMAGTVTDLRSPISSFFYETNEEVKKAKRETYLNETMPFYLKKLEAVAKENGGYLANKKLSWADFVFTCTSGILNIAADSPNVLADYPNLSAIKQKVLDIPQIKKWVAKRPETQY